MKTFVEQESEKMVENFKGWFKDGDGWKATFIKNGKEFEARMGPSQLFLGDAMKEVASAFKNAKEI